MFATPYRLATALRPNVRLGILVAAASASVVFTATPFLISTVVEDFDVSLGLASLISTAQLAGFVVATALAGRRFRASRQVVVGAVAGLVLTNAASAVAPTFAVLVALRGAAGVSLGLITWVAWSEAAGSGSRMRDVAVVGPLTGAVSAPLLGWAADLGGTGLVYATLAVVAATPLALPTTPSADVVHAPRGRRHPAVPAARVILAALFAMTAGGSAVFVYAAAIGRDDVGLGTTTISLAFSLNALVSIPVARWGGARRWAGLGYVGTGTCALVVGLATSGWLFVGALALWGAAFWYGTPGTHQMLALRSRHPTERVGDAQALMAAGRVLGPVIGGLAVGAGSTTFLAVVGASLMGIAGLVIVGVEVLVPPVSGDVHDAEATGR